MIDPEEPGPTPIEGPNRTPEGLPVTPAPIAVPRTREGPSPPLAGPGGKTPEGLPGEQAGPHVARRPTPPPVETPPITPPVTGPPEAPPIPARSVGGGGGGGGNGAYGRSALKRPLPPIVTVETRTPGLGSPFDPVERLESAVAMSPPIVHESALPERNRTILADRNIYTAIVLRGVNTILYDKSFQMSGDHVYVERINSRAPLYIRLGPDSNPWIEMFAGLTLTRAFSKIRVTTGIAGGFDSGCDALLYVSTGPLASFRLPKRSGLGRGTFAFSGTATTTLVDLLNGTTTLTTHGRNGGSVVVENTDVGNNLLLTFENGVSYRLLPGQVFTATYDERAAFSTGGGTFIPSGIGVSTAAGTATYQAIVSSAHFDDTFDTIFGTSGVNAP